MAGVARTPTPPGATTTWPRAIALGAAVVFVAFVALVEVPNLIVSKMTSVRRSLRADLATGWFTVALIALLFGLRRLQQRSLSR